MPYDLSRKFVIGISSRALLDLSREHLIFEKQGARAYEQYQINHEKEVLAPGPAYPLIAALLQLNRYLPAERHIEVVLLSHNSPAASLRVKNSIKHYGLNISRSALTGGKSVVPLLRPFKVDLFLSAARDDVQAAFEAGVASAVLWGLPRNNSLRPLDCVRIAFDGDAVLFDEECERIYQKEGIEAFHKHENQKALEPLKPGPFAKVLLSIAYLQRRLPHDKELLRTALITARNSPADERVVRTIRDHWRISIDEMYMLGGVEKRETVEAFAPHIYFDDQSVHCGPVSVIAPVGQVPSNLYTLTGAIDLRCPKCNAAMVKKEAIRGKNKGKPFYGCTRYPRCDGSYGIA